MLKMLGLLVAIAPGAWASVDVPAVNHVADRIESRFESLASSGSVVRLRLEAFQVSDPADSEAAATLTTALLSRFVANKKFVVVDEAPADYLVTGIIRRLDGSRVAAVRGEDTARRQWSVAGVFELDDSPPIFGGDHPAPAGRADGTEFWLAGGAFGIKDTFAWQTQLTLRPSSSRWEYSLQVAAPFRQETHQLVYLYNGAAYEYYTHSSSLSMVMERLKAAYLVPLRRSASGSRFLFHMPDTLAVGGGVGLYEVHEGVSTGNSREPKVYNKNHFYGLPFAEVGLIWKVLSRGEIRASASGSLESQNLGMGSYRAGGFGYALDASVRLN